jgi:hypothetical protein
MAECDWAILCDYSFLDAGQKVCLIGVFEKINAASVPTTLHQSALALKILGNPEEQISFRIAVNRPSGGALASVAGSVILGPEASSANVQLNFAGLGLPDWGVYEVSVYVNEVLSKSASFVVVPVQQTPQGRTD